MNILFVFLFAILFVPLADFLPEVDSRFSPSVPEIAHDNVSASRAAIPETEPPPVASASVAPARTRTIVPTPQAEPSPPTNPSPPLDTASAIASEVLQLMNHERTAEDMPSLVHSARLQSIAYAHSADMLEHKYFSHENLMGCSSSCRATNAGFEWRRIGENIYMMEGFDLSPQETAQKIVTGWMQSPGHRANILGNFELSGVGIATVGGRVYATALYATPR